MKILRFDGEVSGREYLAWGVGLFLLKLPLDTWVAKTYAGIHWQPWYYFSALQNPLFTAQATRGQWLPMLAAAVPFLYIGLALTVQRLNALRRVPLWAVFFFVPFANVVFFMLLVGMTPPPPDEPKKDHAAAGPLDRFVPEGRMACVVLAMLLTVLFASSTFYLSVFLQMPYGANVFMAVPFLCGYLTRLLIGYRHNVSFWGALWWATVSQLLCAAILVSFAVEGVFCVMIALAVVVPIAWVGAAVAHFTEAHTFPSLRGKTLCVVAIVPLALAFDAMVSYNQPGMRAVVSRVRINATPAVIWNNVVEFPPISRSDGSKDIFDMFMIPRLERAVIEGRGEGALRRCQFHTGEFLEPIEVWQPGRELTFAVKGQPARLEGCIAVRRGQFLFQPMSDGSTVVTGTTWYELSMFPEVYWDLWMGYFLHTTHMRALEHIRDLSERRVY